MLTYTLIAKTSRRTINKTSEKMADIGNWPTLEIVGKHKTIDDFSIKDFILHDYFPFPALPADMA